VTVAIVPVKRLADTKSRLLAHLGPEAREAFALAMLQDVIGALADAASIARTVVVTPDESVADAARGAGAEGLVRDDPGLNPALHEGARALALAADEPLLVVLGDVAGALAADLDALSDALAELGGRGAVLAPSSDGGTSAILRAPHDVIPPCFGPDSAKRHREAASERGVPYRELPLPSLALDLDLPEDVEHFLRTTTGGRATRRALEKIGWSPG
jgi:2-phospho-L-lactate guanylyltransferase